MAARTPRAKEMWAVITTGQQGTVITTQTTRENKIICQVQTLCQKILMKHLPCTKHCASGREYCSEYIPDLSFMECTEIERKVKKNLLCRENSTGEGLRLGRGMLSFSYSWSRGDMLWGVLYTCILTMFGIMFNTETSDRYFWINSKWWTSMTVTPLDKLDLPELV